MSKFVVEMSGDEKKLWQSLQKIANQEENVARKGKKMATTGQKAAGIMKSAFATAAGLAGVGGLAAAIAKVISVAQKASEEVKTIAEGLAESHANAKKLWQVSEGQKGYQEQGDWPKAFA